MTSSGLQRADEGDAKLVTVMKQHLVFVTMVQLLRINVLFLNKISKLLICL